MIVYTDKRRVPFLIDEADYEAVRRYAWSIDDVGYPATNVGKKPEMRRLRLHEFLLGRAPEGLEWDHENRDSLDNRRHNLRAVTHVVNQRNQGLQRNNKSGVIGVHWDRRAGRWCAKIRIPPKQDRHLGYFDDIEEAAATRRHAEQTLWGDIAPVPQEAMCSNA